jgi:hypothetical protein
MTIHTTAPLRDRPAFKALEEHCAEVRKLHLRQLFAEDPVFKTLAPKRGDVSRTPGREKSDGTAEEGYLFCGEDFGNKLFSAMRFGLGGHEEKAAPQKGAA